MGGHGKSSGQSERDRQPSSAYGEPKSSPEAMRISNPYYQESLSRGDDAYTENCNRCWIAYEENRRGADVEAKPTFNGDTWPRVTECLESAYENIDWKNCTVLTDNSSVDIEGTAQKLLTTMTSEGEGARFGVATSWAGSGAGHVFNAEVVSYSGRGTYVKLIDAQTNEMGNIYFDKDYDSIVTTGIATNYLQSIAPLSGSVVGVRGIEVARIDNLTLTQRARNTALRARGGSY